MRGTLSRAELRQIIAATYHQVWWPSTQDVRFAGEWLPVWHEAADRYLDPGTGEFLPTWDEALDAIGPDDEPRHVVRFGAKFDAQGVLAGSKDASRCIGYLTKYLTKQLGDCHHPDSDGQREHVERLADALRYEPCSPTCANWLRYGIQPKNPRPGLVPGQCKGKAHLHFHDLRHTGNHFAAASGASLKDLMARMGHDSERAAIIYLHEVRGADLAITSAIDAHIGTIKASQGQPGDGPPEAPLKSGNGPLMAHRDQQDANEPESHVRHSL